MYHDTYLDTKKYQVSNHDTFFVQYQYQYHDTITQHCIAYIVNYIESVTNQHLIVWKSKIWNSNY